MALAFDRASVRSIDKDGRLHISITPISKATVNPYKVSEVPGFEDLGLDPDRVYNFLRDPEELAKAAPTFNNLPVLSKHVPVNAQEHQPDLIIGSTGTDAKFTAPYLYNSAVVWVQEFIEKIADETQREWSCAYYWTPDMRSGTFEGLRFDGTMRNIIGNHVALVTEGRAGPDVVVGDSKLEMPPMAKALTSKKALLVKGALAAYLAPKLAQDAKVDVGAALGGVTRANFKGSKTKIVAGLDKITKGKLAADASLDDVVELLDSLDNVTDGEVDADMVEQAAEATETPDDDDDENKPAVDADDDMMAKIMAFLKGKLSDEDLAEVAKMTGGNDAPPAQDDEPTMPKGITKPAMDAALKATRENTIAAMTAIRTAEREVQPCVGEVVAMDSASAVYKVALDHMQVDTAGVPREAYGPLFRAAFKPDTATSPNRIAQDGLTDAETRFRAKYPNASPLGGKKRA